MALLIGTGCPVQSGHAILGTQYGPADWDWVPSMAQLDRTGCPVQHGQMGLHIQYGTARRDWVPSMALPDTPGDELGTQYGTARQR